MRSLAYFLLLFLGIPVVVQAAPEKPRFHEVWFGENEGLDLGVPENIVSTPDGFVWFSSYDGLARFDGKSFELFKDDVDSLPNKRVAESVVDAEGTLWLVLDQGYVVRTAKDGFEIVQLAENREDALVEMVWTAADGVWLVGRRFLIKRLHDGTIQHRLTTPNLPWGNKHLFKDGSVLLWDDARAYLISPKGDGKWLEHKPGDPSAHFLTAWDGLHGEKWIGTDKAVLRLEEERLVLQPLEGVGGVCFGHTSSQGDVYLRGFDTWWRVRDGKAETLTHTDPGIHCDAKIAEIEGSVLYSEGSRLMWEGEVVADFGRRIRELHEHKGDLWLVIGREGVVRLRKPEVDILGGKEGLPEGLLFTLLNDDKGALWAGVWNKGVVRWNTAFPERERTLSTFHPLADLYKNASFIGIGALYQDPRGKIWLGGWDGLRFLKDGAFVELHASGIDRNNNAIHTVFEDSTGTAWVGNDTGLMKGSLREPLKPWVKISPEEGIPDNTRIYTLVETEKQDLLVGTAEHGVLLKKKGDTSFVEIGRGTPLELSYVRSLVKGAEGEFWASTESDGLCRIVLGDGEPEISCVNKRHGLLDQGVHCTASDAQGRLWMSGNSGISWVSLDRLDSVLDGKEEHLLPISFGKWDGMANEECNGGFQSACVQDPEGRIYFPTQEGVAMVDPREIDFPEVPSPVLSAYRVEGGPRILFPAHKERKIELSADERRLEVWWSAPSSYRGTQVQYQVRLTGADKTWIVPTEGTHTLWTNLPASTFDLEVRAGLGSRWGEPVRLARVRRAPAFYETWWFSLAGALLALLGLFLAVRAYTLNLRRRRDELERMVQERTATIEDRNRALETQAFALEETNYVLTEQRELLSLQTTQLSQANQALTSQKTMLAERSRQLSEQAERLTELAEVKNRFVANVSHELRTPLTLVRGTVQSILEGDAGLSDQSRRHIEIAERNANRLAELVEQLLEIARLEAGAVPLKVRKVDLSQFLRLVASRFDHVGAAQSMTWEVEVPEHPVPVYFAPDMVDKAITNLLGNAFKFTHEGGRVALRMWVEGGHEGRAMISVSDSGVGVAEEDQARLFDRFYQTHDRDNRAHEGTGLGLAITREFVELHGGEISVQSAPGEGSTFTFSIPLGVAHLSPEDIDLQEHQEGPAERSQRVEAPEGSFTIMVVEDHPDMRAYIADHLREFYRVVEACNGAQALSRVQESKPDLIVSDIMMPGVDGLEMARRLQAQKDTSSIPLLMVSAKGGGDTRLESLEVADDFLGKPFLMGELLSRVARLLPQSSATEPKATPGDPPKPQSEETGALEDASSSPQASLSLVDQDLLEELQKTIEEHLSSESLNVDTLADHMNMSRRALYRASRRLLGMPPAGYIRELRLQRANKALLEGAFATVGEVASSIGMTSTYFARVYKSRFGVSPGKDLKKASRA